MKTYIIAEIGTSHQGDLAKARELIGAVRDCGADCAKFQVVFAEEIIHPLTGELDLPGGRVRLFDRFKAVEQDQDFYRRLKEECEAAGLDFLASPFGIRSARLLRQIGASSYKIASPEVNHFPLLDEVRSYGKPVILSSGVSLLGDLEAAFAHLEGVPVSLLHCITAYPAPEQEYNLRVLEPLSVLFGCPVGVSDHSLDPVAVPLCSVAVGGTLIEKHICLSRQDPGLDDPIALEPGDFQRMCREVRQLESLPTGERKNAVETYLGTHRAQAVWGSGRKVLAPSEKANYERTNRSLHVWETLEKGQVLTRDQLGILRTEKVLRPGIGPQFLDLVVGKRLVRRVDAGQGLVWEDLID